MFRLVRAALVIALLLVGRDVSANWFRTQAPVVTAYYYCPVSVICVPTFPVSMPTYAPPPATTGVPAPQLQQQPGYAKPSPAPPSGSAAPGVDESRRSNYFDAYAVEKPSAGATDRCTVGFWNQSAQEVTVTVDGQPRTLQRGQGVTLDLPRRFVWQIAGRESVQETIAGVQSGVDIVIRR